MVSACPAAGEDSDVVLAREHQLPDIHGRRCPNDQLPHRFIGDQHGPSSLGERWRGFDGGEG